MADDKTISNIRGLEVDTLAIWDLNNMIIFSLKKSMMITATIIFLKHVRRASPVLMTEVRSGQPQRPNFLPTTVLVCLQG